MNKQAKKLKNKRRAEREAIKNENINKAWDNMTYYSTSAGCKPMKKTKEQMLKVYNATKEIDAKILNKSGVITLIISLIVLYKCYHYNKEQLISYAKRLRTFILNLGKNERPVSLLMDEIENDYNVSINDKCKIFSRVQMSDIDVRHMEDTIIKCTVDNFPYFITINTYTFMNHLINIDESKVWNSEDLEMFLSESIVLYNRILTDTKYLNVLNDILTNERDVRVDLDTGTIHEIIKQ